MLLTDAPYKKFASGSPGNSPTITAASSSSVTSAQSEIRPVFMATSFLERPLLITPPQICLIVTYRFTVAQRSRIVHRTLIMSAYF